MRTILFSVLVAFLGAATGCKKQPQTSAAHPSAEQPAPPTDAAAPAEQTTPAEAAAPAQTPTSAQQPTVAQKPQQPAAQMDKLPGAAVIRAHLKNKDYDQAVGGLMALRGIAEGNSETWIQYRQLCGEVGSTLAAAAKTDRNAAQALANYTKVLYGSNPNP